ncbi:MAG: hypothetical protein ACQETX_02165 [Pseudomonadota bacterium]|nr:hypothetical protein [Fodinicurvata fenggangensis]
MSEELRTENELPKSASADIAAARATDLTDLRLSGGALLLLLISP